MLLFQLHRALGYFRVNFVRVRCHSNELCVAKTNIIERRNIKTDEHPEISVMLPLWCSVPVKIISSQYVIFNHHINSHVITVNITLKYQDKIQTQKKK